MNIVLRVLQVALAWLSVAGGVYQIFELDELSPGVAAMRAGFIAYGRFVLSP